MDDAALLAQVTAYAADYLNGITERPVAAAGGVDELRAALHGPTPEHPSSSFEVIDTPIARDVSRQGLFGAPRITVIAGDQRHVSIDRAVRHLGMGSDALVLVASDGDSRMRVDRVADALAGLDGPFIVCTQVGDVNTGAIDPVGDIADVAHRSGGWVHVNGAFGLWAAASPALAPMVTGVDRADSTDKHRSSHWR